MVLEKFSRRRRTPLRRAEMICFEVYVNGKRVCLAGVGETGVLSGILTWVKRGPHQAHEDAGEDDIPDEDVTLHVGGLGQHGKDALHLDWADEDLNVGDEVLLRIVERDKCDPPEDARTNIAELVEQGRREYYEKLKEEYEGEGPTEGA
jgi:hypothetical protein